MFKNLLLFIFLILFVTLVKAKKAYFDEEKYDKSSSELINRKYCNLHNYFNDSRNQEILKCVFKQNHIVC